MKKFVVTQAVAVALMSMLVMSSGVTLATASAATAVHHGIVPIRSTNEGGSGGPGPATGILDITAGPCVGIVQSTREYESIPSRITLRHGSKVVARWDIYGQQRIAWVEPVGTYLIHSNQPPTVNKEVRVVVSSSHVATVRLMPDCL
jgi:hypothetical protein